MEGTINIDGKDVKFTLTPEQEAEVKRKSVKITDRVEALEDVLLISGRTKESLYNDNDRSDDIARKEIELIAEVYNEETILDPLNTDQYKYFPLHEIDPTSGFGLSYYDYAYWGTYTDVGPRLCFKSAELAIDAGKKFIEVYARYYQTKK
jgi:hypothetical protein